MPQFFKTSINLQKLCPGKQFAQLLSGQAPSNFRSYLETLDLSKLETIPEKKYKEYFNSLSQQECYGKGQTVYLKLDEGTNSLEIIMPLFQGTIDRGQRNIHGVIPQVALNNNNNNDKDEIEQDKTIEYQTWDREHIKPDTKLFFMHPEHQDLKSDLYAILKKIRNLYQPNKKMPPVFTKIRNEIVAIDLNSADTSVLSSLLDRVQTIASEEFDNMHTKKSIIPEIFSVKLKLDEIRVLKDITKPDIRKANFLENEENNNNDSASAFSIYNDL